MVRFNLIFIVLMLIFTSISAQKRPDFSEDSIHTLVDKMPMFRGGDAALNQYLKKLKYPPMAKEEGIEGIVLVKFVVDKTGKVGRAEVVQSANPQLDEAAMHFVLSMPRWHPGMRAGEPVSVAFQMPLYFKLHEEKVPDKKQPKGRKVKK